MITQQEIDDFTEKINLDTQSLDIHNLLISLVERKEKLIDSVFYTLTHKLEGLENKEPTDYAREKIWKAVRNYSDKEIADACFIAIENYNNIEDRIKKLGGILYNRKHNVFFDKVFFGGQQKCLNE